MVERFNLGSLHELEAFFPNRNWRMNFTYIKEINAESLHNLYNLENHPCILFVFLIPSESFVNNPLLYLLSFIPSTYPIFYLE